MIKATAKAMIAAMQCFHLGMLAIVGACFSIMFSAITLIESISKDNYSFIQIAMAIAILILVTSYAVYSMKPD